MNTQSLESKLTSRNKDPHLFIYGGFTMHNTSRKSDYSHLYFMKYTYAHNFLHVRNSFSINFLNGTKPVLGYCDIHT